MSKSIYVQLINIRNRYLRDKDYELYRDVLAEISHQFFINQEHIPREIQLSLESDIDCQKVIDLVPQFLKELRQGEFIFLGIQQISCRNIFSFSRI